MRTFSMLHLLKKKNIHVSHAASIVGTEFEHNIKLEKGDYNYATIGRDTYCNQGCRLDRTLIGRYCSIGRNCHVIKSTHPKEYVSTSPCFYSTKQTWNVTYVSVDKYNDSLQVNGYNAIIGNDVWIGDNVMIRGGIKIGDGAIIGMGAVVTRDVPPYAIVGGIPAKIIGYRFSESLIAQLLAIQWWQKEEDWVKNHADEFDDIEAFISKHGISNL